jgi:hypothetical protein
VLVLVALQISYSTSNCRFDEKKGVTVDASTQWNDVLYATKGAHPGAKGQVEKEEAEEVKKRTATGKANAEERKAVQTAKRRKEENVSNTAIRPYYLWLRMRYVRKDMIL